MASHWSETLARPSAMVVRTSELAALRGCKGGAVRGSFGPRERPEGPGPSCRSYNRLVSARANAAGKKTKHMYEVET